MYGCPGQEEDEADQHQDEVCPPPPGQLPLLSLAEAGVGVASLCPRGSRCDRVGNSVQKYLSDFSNFLSFLL